MVELDLILNLPARLPGFSSGGGEKLFWYKIIPFYSLILTTVFLCLKVILYTVSLAKCLNNIANLHPKTFLE